MSFLITMGEVVAVGASIFGVLYLLICGWVTFDDRRSERGVVRDLHRADTDLSTALRSAKRQMNRAAGHSWRNPFE
ncbi:hypothetical protein [Rudaeicoccus suwonensis]|uniref:hypothetical protein n=1 Tax=Rudaeicoccus suwonensis TaxID=657409 RepID=UPI0011A6E551|nr:hypothetical protein [Rudaeicoccus suwonensis]